jgi:hypothetical protein
MQSPSHEPKHNDIDPVDLAALTLEPAAAQGPSSSRHLFSFESGSTWGAAGTSGSNDWGMPASSNVFSADGGQDTPITSAFLNLGTASNTWGGVSGFGGALNGDRSTGE